MTRARVPACLGAAVYPEVPEGGWGWAVAAAFFLVEINTYGVLKSLGVFLQDLMEEFQESNSRVSWVISISVFIFAFTAPLATLLSNRFGYRAVVMMGGFLISLGTISSAFTNSINEMYVTIGIVSGLGYCLAFLPTLTLLAQYFSKRRALVTSVASSGESFAMFAFAPAFSRLKQDIGWRSCLVVVGILQASVIGCGLLLRPIIIRPDVESDTLKRSAHELDDDPTQTSISSQDSQDSGITSLSTSNPDLKMAAGSKAAPEPCLAEEGGASRLLDFSALRDPAFICYSLFGLFATLGFFAPQIYVIPLSRSRGVAPGAASCMLSVMAVADVLGRLSVGVVLERAPCRKTLVLLGSVVLMGLVLVAFTVVTEFWGLAVCSALYGFFMGTVGSTHIPLLAEDDVVGIRRMPACVGVYVFIQSFAGLAGPPLGGVLVDATQNYGAAFYSCAAGLGVGAVCLALVGPAKAAARRRRSQETREDGDEETPGDGEQVDFLEVDLEDGPVPPAGDRTDGSVI